MARLTPEEAHAEMARIVKSGVKAPYTADMIKANALKMQRDLDRATAADYDPTAKFDAKSYAKRVKRGF
ncbi:hypothetical protein [Mesorhizobium sp.]|uniref:hypothetical protein n=1 Tax=Mesorhizobium sp. TaxID=1871066 RepID=UPI000FE53D74|nr:hypothetical protein [Mesorhizobium sp.]RWE86948.1 MAG: hypothetical protein EOS49_11840 [Mesorhizobium sp.]